MPPNVRGVMAAPNRCEIKARVLQVRQSARFPDKWHFELEFLESRQVSGPNFARVGEQAQGFSFGSFAGLSPGAIITAEAEFLGDERGGQFQLYEVEVTNPS